MRKARRLIVVAVALLGLLGPAGIAHAANSYTVTTTTDSNDGTCTATLCSLRDAVVAADNAGGTTTITLPAGTYTLAIPSTGQNNPQHGDLDIDNNASVTIVGAGAGSTTINANHVDRAFAVQGGASLSLSGMTIENGTPSTNSTGSGLGGAIFVSSSSGALTVEDSTFSGNSASVGGAIDDDGSSSATLDGDRFVANTAQQEAGGVLLESSSSGTDVVDHDEFDDNIATGSNAAGGALIAVAAGPLESTGSSFIDNTATGMAGAIGFAGRSFSLVNATISGNQAPAGAGIFFANTSPTTMTNDTIAFNAASTAGGGAVYATTDVTSGSGTTGVRNTIIAQNTGGDCSNGGGAAQFTSTVDAGNNLDSDSSCFTGATDKVGVANPLVAQPADNGGPVLTDRLQTGSPAIDGGTDVGCPGTDARGVARPQRASCDIGAYEVAPARLSLAGSAPATAPVGVPFNDTITVSNAGPAPSTGTTVTDQLPPNSGLYGSSASQGSCSSTGSPATVTCQLGSIAAGASATVTLAVAYSQPGFVTNIASATNDEGGSTSGGWATTNVQAPVAPAGAIAPTATTGAVGGIGESTATLSGTVATGGQATAYFFEYGTSGTYGNITPIAQSTGSTQGVLAAITGLKAGTRYHYRLVAINDSGSSFGADRTFRTSRGRLVLDSGKLTVKKGTVQVPFTCASTTACAGSFSILARVNPKKTVRCTAPGKTTYRLAAGKRKLVKAALSKSCLTALAAHHGTLAAELTAKPKTGQAAVVNKTVRLR